MKGRLIMSQVYKYDHTSDAELYNEVNPIFDIPMVPLLQAILKQAVSDAIKLKPTSSIKLEATQWLCDEDNELLQLCLSCVTMDYQRMIRKVAKQGWNLSL